MQIAHARACLVSMLYVSIGALALAAEPQPVLILHFDEGEGVVARDASDRCHNGRLQGPTWTDGHAGRALHFDGKSRVDLGRPEHFEFGKQQDFTLELWLRVAPDLKPDWYFVLTNRLRLEDTPGYTIFLDKAFQVNVAVGDKVNWIDLLTARQPLNDGQWHRVTLTCERRGMASLYLDGKLHKQSSMAEIVTVSNGELPLLIGSRGYSGDFIGDLDEVTIWRGIHSPSPVGGGQ
jgi:hypothetical protein